MANDFTTDPSCKAHWRFETGALTTDSIGGNTLAAVGTPASSNVQFKEGSWSCLEDVNDRLQITDANLDVDFPLKSGDTNKIIGVGFWIYFNTLNSENNIFMKWGAGADYTFTINTNTVASVEQFAMRLAITTNTFETVYHGTQIVTGRWYHVGATYKDSNRSWKMRIWDDTAGELLGGAEVTGTAGNSIWIDNGNLVLGWGSLGTDGYLDDTVVFNRVLLSTEIDAIRQQIYNGPLSGVADNVLQVGSDF